MPITADVVAKFSQGHRAIFCHLAGELCEETGAKEGSKWMGRGSRHQDRGHINALFLAPRSQFRPATRLPLPV